MNVHLSSIVKWIDTIVDIRVKVIKIEYMGQNSLSIKGTFNGNNFLELLKDTVDPKIAEIFDNDDNIM